MANASDIVKGIGGGSDEYTTWALGYLADFLGPKVVYGTGDISGLTALATTLSPLWQAITILLMLSVMAVGLVKTATEKKFLGNWNSVGAPVQLGLCLLLLTPMSNNVTFGQVLFMKTIVIGNNAGDFLWKSVAQSLQSANTVITDSTGKKYQGTETFIASRMSQATQPILCAETLMGKQYATKPSYAESIKNCGIPSSLLGYYVGNPAGGNVVHESLKSVVTPSVTTLRGTTSSYDGVGGEDLRKAVEMACYIETYRKVISYGNPEAGAKGTPIIIPVHVGDQITIDKDALSKVGNQLVKDANTCVFDNLISRTSSFEKSELWSGTKGSQNDLMWQYGWASAAANGDLLGDSKRSYTSTVNQSPIDAEFNESGLPKNDPLLLDKDTIKYISQAIISLGYANPSIGGIDAEGVAGSIAGVAGAGAVSKPAMAAFDKMGEIMGGPKDFVGPPKPGRWSTAFRGFTNIMRASAFGKAGSAMLSKLQKSSFLVKGAAMVSGAVGSVAQFIPGIGQVAGAFLSALSDLVNKSSDIKFQILGGLFVIFGSFDLIPQAFMTIAVFLWMVRVVTWFAVLPMVVTVIAIPNTRAGHDIWKDLLALTLTPILIVFFYVMGTIASGLLAEYSFVSMFSVYCEVAADKGSFGCSDYRVMDMLVDFLTGELITRIIVWGGIVIAGLAMTGAMMLRGPTVIFHAMGLTGKMSETEVMGSDLSQGLQQSRGKIGL